MRFTTLVRPLSGPTGQLMGEKPEQLSKANSNAHAKAMIVWKTAAVKRKQSFTSRVFGADLRSHH